MGLIDRIDEQKRKDQTAERAAVGLPPEREIPANTPEWLRRGTEGKNQPRVEYRP